MIKTIEMYKELEQTQKENEKKILEVIESLVALEMLIWRTKKNTMLVLEKDLIK